MGGPGRGVRGLRGKPEGRIQEGEREQRNVFGRRGVGEKEVPGVGEKEVPGGR